MVLPIVLPPSTVAPTVDLPTAPVHRAATGAAGREHVVRDGETLYDLAQRYGTSVGAIQRRSGLTTDVIHPGQRLRLPTAGAPQARSGARSGTPARTAATRRYTVRPGDTLFGIAARHGMSLGRLQALNALDSSVVHPGQQLRVSGTASRPAKRPTGRTSGARHTVRDGETLSGIAARHQMSVTRLAKINGLSTASFIRPGQRLAVQGRAATLRPTTTEQFSETTFYGRTYSRSVLQSAERTRQRLASRSVPSRSAVRATVARTARQHGVDPGLALAVSYQESGWDHRQVSIANAIGVMQVIPSSGDWASQMAGRRLDLLDTEDNITAGVLILKALTRAASSDSQAIAGYYQGLASVRANGMYADTRIYVANVRHHRSRM